MIVGSICIFHGERCHRERYWFPVALSQKFKSNPDLPMVEYLNDLDLFETQYKMERMLWLREHHIKHSVDYTSEPYSPGRGGVFTMVVSFANVNDAASYKKQWGTTGGKVLPI